MRLKTILSAAGAVGITAALALGAATPANAASTDAGRAISAQADRLKGPFQTKTQYDYSNRSNWVADGDRVNIGSGGVWTFPVVGQIGSIHSLDANKCLTLPPSPAMGVKMRLEACDGRLTQQWNIAENGMISSATAARWTISDGAGVGIGPMIIAAGHGMAMGADCLWFTDLVPVSEVADLTADVAANDAGAKTAVIGGTGEPGATIELTGPWGSETTIVDENGKWSKEIGGLATGDNPVTVTQKVEGAEDQIKLLKVSFDAAKLIGDVVAVDADAKTADVRGTGEPGVELEVTGPDGKTEKVVVDKDGNWSITVPNLEEGDNPITVKDPATGEQLDLIATLLPSPIVAPAIAGGAGIAAIAALGATLLVRRRNTVKQ